MVSKNEPRGYRNSNTCQMLTLGGNHKKNKKKLYPSVNIWVNIIVIPYWYEVDFTQLLRLELS